MINSKSPLEEIREQFPSAQDRARRRREDARAGLVDLVNAPERAAALLRAAHDKTSVRRPFVTHDTAYIRFVAEGARVTDGSFVESRHDRLRLISSSFLPRNMSSQLVGKLQR